MSLMYTAEPVRVVCIDDPAIDEDATGDQTLGLYNETREFSLLKFREGVAPAVYEVGRLTTSQVARINRSTTSEDGRHEIAFLMGVVRAENFPATDGTIHRELIPEHIRKPKPRQAAQMTEAEFNLFPIDHVYEIGAVALQRAPLVPGRPVCFVPPLSSAVALGRKMRASRRAAIQSPGTNDKGPPSSA